MIDPDTKLKTRLLKFKFHMSSHMSLWEDSIEEGVDGGKGNEAVGRAVVG